MAVDHLPCTIGTEFTPFQIRLGFLIRVYGLETLSLNLVLRLVFLGLQLNCSRLRSLLKL